MRRSLEVTLGQSVVGRSGPGDLRRLEDDVAACAEHFMLRLDAAFRSDLLSTARA